MRPAARLRGGFYPAHQLAVSHAATFLRPPRDQPFCLLDPCAGEGAALSQLAATLGCFQAQTFAIELDDSRAAILHQALPHAHVLAPASFFGCRASHNSFSLIWLNPPFDDAYGGHRIEEQFLITATEWLMPGGVMVLVCPEDVASDYSLVRRHFATYYDHCTKVPFPKDHRPFNEVLVMGHKRSRARADADAIDWDNFQAPTGFRYDIPAGNGPKFFHKVEPTQTELQSMLAKSPLRTHLTMSPAVPLPSPPLALGIGHVALLLASGHLDGVVTPAGESPHVVRGTSRKRQFVSEMTETDNPDGSTSTRTILSERIDLVVRTVDLSGQIQTFGDDTSEEDNPSSSTQPPNPHPPRKRGNHANSAGTPC